MASSVPKTLIGTAIGLIVASAAYHYYYYYFIYNQKKVGTFLFMSFMSSRMKSQWLDFLKLSSDYK